ncbi:4'-phosphopantetheinyl transferase family protein [Stappia indica]|uniref:4'-phosphopantetheinyl transferase family protein n=1 Tax=Stappia indica TaxID=538381 RepID=UPI001CD6D956|nr:4'-phosphopantetheinyl transferase superfamily protein [Stappia indica]MCA1299725.1 4'-phosphopantetheinyl transferase superfamily protein [Stappia indica]
MSGGGPVRGVAGSGVGQRLFADWAGQVHVVEDRGFRLAEPLFAEEEAAIVRAVPLRRREFIAGRTAARRALAGLDIAPCPIPVAADRAPCWPGGVVGSISHSPALVLAAVAREREISALGVDAEVVARLEPEIIAAVCTEEDRRFLAGGRGRLAGIGPLLVFSAKEAFYKAFYPLHRRFLDHDAVAIRFFAAPGGETGSFRVIAREPGLRASGFADRVAGRWALAGDHVYAAAVVPGPG